MDDAAAGAASVVESGGATRPSRRPEDSLIAALRRKATEYAQTGVDPELLQSLSEALQHHPGTERAARLREMQSCEKDFEALVMEGKASVANINELIRAQALQGRMADAMQTHDAMKLHGYAPDAETFVSLLAGAAHQRNADLARKLFLKMREQLISATPKVYATLIQAHVRAGDTASGYALLRKMEDESIQPDVVVHTVLINGLVNEGRIERAWEEFHAARTWKLIQPDEVLFTVMIKACAIMQEAERALNLLDDLRTCGLYPTDITYGEIIHAVSTTSDHARKAFDFYRQMQAEDLPVSAFVFEHLLQACRHLGDAKRAKALVEEMGEQHVVLSPVMYNHLVGLFATAMRRPHVSDVEKLQNLRHAWGVVSAAREAYSDKLDWTSLLNEIVGVYVAEGFSDFAMDMLPQYAVFGAEPDAETWEHLLRMLGERDIGRFFTLWNSVPKPLPEELYQVALDVALRSRSSQQTCAILEEMYTVPVFPSPQLTERLARAGRHIIQHLGAEHERVGFNVVLSCVGGAHSLCSCMLRMLTLPSLPLCLSLSLSLSLSVTHHALPHSDTNHARVATHRIWACLHITTDKVSDKRTSPKANSKHILQLCVCAWPPPKLASCPQPHLSEMFGKGVFRFVQTWPKPLSISVRIAQLGDSFCKALLEPGFVCVTGRSPECEASLLGQLVSQGSGPPLGLAEDSSPDWQVFERCRKQDLS